jgi:hypothetical protein
MGSRQSLKCFKISKKMFEHREILIFRLIQWDDILIRTKI